jgi:hypothetical protein
MISSSASRGQQDALKSRPLTIRALRFSASLAHQMAIQSGVALAFRHHALGARLRDWLCIGRGGLVPSVKLIFEVADDRQSVEVIE